MAALRSVAILLVVLTVLPWGAFSGALAAQARPLAGWSVTVAGADTRPVLRSPDEPQDAAFVAPAPKRCRTAGLIGSSCGLDIALAKGMDPLAPATARWQSYRQARKVLVGVTPPGSLDPPRFC